MVSSLKHLELEWVDGPRDEWTDDLESMAEGYPFEKKRKNLQSVNQIERCRRSWSSTGTDEKFLAAHFDNTLVGWIKLQENKFQSSFSEHTILNATWELVQRNRNDIRDYMLDSIRTRFPENIIHFQQPAQNRTGRNWYRSQTEVYSGGLELYKAKWGDSLDQSLQPDCSTSKFSQLSTGDAEIVTDIVKSYSNSYLHEHPLFDSQTATQMHLEWVKRTIDSDSYQTWILTDDSNPVGLVIVRLNEALDGERSSASISYIQVHPDYQRSGLGETLLTKAEYWLTENDVYYTEIKMNNENSSAIKFYSEHGYEPVTKREHFYLIPDTLADRGKINA